MMKNNWQYKLCVTPLLLIFGAWTIIHLWSLWFCLKVQWFILTNPKLWLISIFDWRLYIYDFFAASPFFSALFAVFKLWEVWDIDYFEKRLGVTLGVTFGAPVVIILSNLISKWAIMEFFASIGYTTTLLS